MTNIWPILISNFIGSAVAIISFMNMLALFSSRELKNKTHLTNGTEVKWWLFRIALSQPRSVLLIVV